MHAPKRIAAIGELVWDLLPGATQLGGAPANFAAMSANLTANPTAVPPANRCYETYLIGRVGDDALGEQALRQLARHRVHLDAISLDPSHATGSVTVVLSSDADPVYRIHEDVAWDYLAMTPQLHALAASLDAICFGTLAQRCPVTRATLRVLVETTRTECLRVFDVNLRDPYWTSEELRWGCAHATILKMSEGEVAQVLRAVGASPSPESPLLQAARLLLDRFPIQTVAITRGERGSLLVTREAVHDHPGVASKVADSIGAGDAFTAALTLYALRKRPLAVIAEAANRLGAWVASQRGGMPFLDEGVRAEVEAAIEAAGSV